MKPPARQVRLRVALASGQMLQYAGNGRVALSREAIAEYRRAFRAERGSFFKRYRGLVRQATKATLEHTAEREASAASTAAAAPGGRIVEGADGKEGRAQPGEGRKWKNKRRRRG